MNNSEIYKRLYKDYSKKYIKKILISVFFGVLVAASTSAIAWLLDPAIKKIFVEKDQSLIFVIPLLIIVAFTICLLYTSPSPRDGLLSRMPSSA